MPDMPELSPIFVEAFAFAAACATLYAFFSETMIPLRIAAIVANVLFVVYGVLSESWMLLVLHIILLPLNFGRLAGMRRLVQDAKQASDSDLNVDWLRPYMKPLKLEAGTILFRKDDVAREAYYVVDGEVEVIEIGLVLGAGNLFGEIALFTEGNRRTMSMRCRTDVQLLSMDYDDFRALYYQNPQFGFYLLRLVVRRLQQDAGLLNPKPAQAPASGPALT
jgi:hypothetical protein